MYVGNGSYKDKAEVRKRYTRMYETTSVITSGFFCREAQFEAVST